MKRPSPPAGGWLFVGLRLPALLWERARTRARKSGEPVRALVQRCLETELRKKKRAPERTARA